MKYKINDKVIFRWNGSNRVGVVKNVRRYKKMYLYDVEGENKCVYDRLPLSMDDSKLCCISHRLTKSIGTKII